MSFMHYKRKAQWGHGAGGYMGSGGGGGGDSTTTTELPGYAQPAAQQILSTSSQLSQSGVPQYTGQTYAGMNGTQTNAIGALGNLGSSGGNTAAVQNSVVNAANNGGNNFATQTGQNATAGYNQYANLNNPALQGTIQAANQPTIQAFNQNAMNTNAQFAGSGAFGGSAYQNAQNNNNATLAQQLGNNAANITSNAYNTAATAAGQNAQLQTQVNQGNQQNQLAYANLNSGNYNAAQGRAQTAAQLAGGLDNQQIANQQAAYGAGTAQQTDQQNQLNAAYQQWYGNAMAPYENLGVLESGLSAALGNGAQGVSSTSQSASPLALGVGAGTVGASLLGSYLGH